MLFASSHFRAALFAALLLPAFAQPEAAAAATLTLQIPRSAREGDGLLQGTVTTSPVAVSALVVTLNSSDPTEITVPPTVTIPAGQTSANFPITIVDDARLDPKVATTISAQAANATGAAQTVSVVDNESRAIVVTLPAPLREGDGIRTGTVRIGGTLPAALTVNLTASDPSELAVPATMTIPAGQTSANFTLVVVDDTLTDGAQPVTITATIPSLGIGTATASVADNDPHHFTIAPFGTPQFRGTPFPVTILAKDVNDAVASGFIGTATLSASNAGGSVAMTPAVTTAFSVGQWVGNVTVSVNASGVVLRAANGAVSGASDPFDVIGTVVQTLPLSASDLLFDPGTQRIWASTSLGLVTIDPLSGASSAPVPVGASPGKLARSGDGHYLYIALDNAVRRFDLLTLTPGLQWSLGTTSGSPYQVGDLAVLPDSAESVAVALLGVGGNIGPTVIYDGATKRIVQTQDGSHYLAFGDTPGALFGHNGSDFDTMAVDASGVSLTSRVLRLGGGTDIAFGAGRIFLGSGEVVDPATRLLLGRFGASGLFTLDVAGDRVFFLTGSGADWTLRAFSITSFLEVGALAITGVSGTPGSLVRWGDDGLAFRTTGQQLYLIRTPALVPSPARADLALTQLDAPDPAATGRDLTYTLHVTNLGLAVASSVTLTDTLPAGVTFLSATASQGTTSQSGGVVTCQLGALANRATATVLVVVRPTTTGTKSNTASVTSPLPDPELANNSSTVTTVVQAPGTGARIARVALPAADLVYDSASARLWATVPGSAGAIGNSLVPIDPLTGAIGRPVFIGSDPHRLAITDRAQRLYAGLDGARALSWLDLPAQTPGLPFAVGSNGFDGLFGAEDLTTVPGSIDAVAVARRNFGSSARHEGVAIFDHGVRRALVTPDFSGSSVLAFAGPATTLFGWGDGYLYTMSVSAAGVTITDLDPDLLSGGGGGLESDGGRLYTNGGRIVEPFTRTLLGTIAVNGPVRPDAAANRIYYLTTSGTTVTLRAFNATTFAAAGTQAVTGINDTANSLVRWGANGLAFRTDGGLVVILESATLVPAPAAALALGAAVSEGDGVLVGRGTITLAATSATDTIFTLASDDPTELTVPATVNVRAGQLSAVFDLTIVDDSELDGTRTATITATRTGFVTLRATLDVRDNESATLGLVFPTSATEGATVQGTVTVSAAPAADVAIALAASPPGLAVVPTVVTIPAGQTSVNFPIQLFDGGALEGARALTISAQVAGWVAASRPLDVLDNEARTLAVSAPGLLVESAGVLRGAGVVTLGGALSTELTVALASSNTGAVRLPASVVIPAGQLTATFDLTIVDDTAADGTQSAVVAASAASFTAGSRTVAVLDDDPHHFTFAPIASPQAGGQPFTVTISARDASAAPLSVFRGSVNLAGTASGAPFSVTPATVVFSAGTWTGNVAVPGPAANARLVATAGGATGSSNFFAVLTAPDIAVTPPSLALTLNSGDRALRTLAVANTGGAPLMWSLTAATISATEPALPAVLASLNQRFAAVTALIPARFSFTEGVTGTYFTDGGDDMYDNGNFLSTNLGNNLPYSDNALATSPLLAGASYFTRKFDGLFVLAADLGATVNHFGIGGNLGADISGVVDGAVLSLTHAGVHYRGFVKRVFNSFNPSVNHLVIVRDNGSATHEFSTSSDDDYHRVTGLGGVTRLYYLLFAGKSGAYIDDAATLEIMRAFLVALATPDWLTAAPASGIVGPGASQAVTLDFNASRLAAATHNAAVIFTANDPDEPLTEVPIALTVLGAPAILATPASLAFGSQPVPTVRDVTIASNGTNPLTVTAITASGAQFGVATPTSFTLAPGTTRTVPVTFTPLGLAASTGTLTIASNATSDPLITVPLSGQGSVHHFDWNPIATQQPDVPFAATVTARDAANAVVTAFTGPAQLRALAPITRPDIGTDTTADYVPFLGSYHDARTQVIYLPSELGGPGRITALALYVVPSGASTFNSWTIRLKHTELSSYATALWEGTGWTEVYRTTFSPSGSGWVTFPLSVPFDYDGTSHLAVDFSFDNAAIGNTANARYTNSSPIPRAVYGFSNSTAGDPRAWSGLSGATPIGTYIVPNIRFTVEAPFAVQPAATGPFTAGAWSGQLSVPFAAPSVRLAADDGAGHTGASNAFAVQNPTLPGARLPFTEDFENPPLSSAWTLSGTGPYRTAVTTANGPHGGARHLTLDAPTFDYARNEATLTLDLAGYSGVVLTFWVKDFGDQPHGPPPSPFTGGADFDGVAISADGVNFYEVQELRTFTATWTQVTVNLDAALAARGLSYGPGFKIRFNQYDVGYIPFAGLAIDDLAIAGTAANRLTVTLPAQVTEGAGVLSGTVALPAVRGTPTVVALASSAPARIAVQGSVTIPAGALSANFNFTVLEDAIFDGGRFVVIAPTAAGLVSAPGVTQFLDNDLPTLTLSAPASANEASGTFTATLSLGAAAAGSLTFHLASSDPTELQVPASVTFALGQTAVSFPVTIIDDPIIDGPQPVTLTASAPGWAPATAIVSVADNESASLSLSVQTIAEGENATAIVRTSGTLLSPLVVTFTNTRPAELTVAPSVTIPAGQNSATFAISGVDDAVQDGAQPVTVAASAPGFTSASAQVYVADNDVHHFTWGTIASPQIANRTFYTTLNAYDFNNNRMSGFTGAVNLSAAGSGGALPVVPSTVTLYEGILYDPIAVGAPASAVVLTASNGGAPAISNAFDVTVGPLHHFTWSAIASPKTAGVPFTASLSASDEYGNTVPTFTGTAALSCGAPARAIGTGNLSLFIPLAGSARSCRSQVIYTAAELGPGARSLTALSLDLRQAPSALSAWTIRIKHTPLASFTTPSWDGSGWTVVHQSTFAPTATGPVLFAFSTPFAYNGVSNLLIDFSFNNPAITGTDGYWPGTDAGVNRTVYLYSYSDVGNPLTWSGATPAASLAPNFPNLRLHSAPTVSLVPATSGAFVGGVWNGQLTPQQGATGVVLRAVNGFTSGESNLFNIAAALALTDTDGDGLPDAWESAHGLDPSAALGADGAEGDADGDGLCNLLELAFGLNPDAAEASNLPVVTIEPDPADGLPYLIVRYRRLLAPGALTYTLEVSQDLATWSAAESDAQELAPALATGDGHTEIVTLRVKPPVATPGNLTRYLRLRVTAQ